MQESQNPVTLSAEIQEHSLRDFLYVLFRHKFKICFAFLLVSGGFAYHAYRTPDRYRSEAKVLVKVGRSASVDPSVIGPAVNVGQSRKEEVNSELAIMRSPSIVEKAVDKIGAEKIFETLNGQTRRQLGGWNAPKRSEENVPRSRQRAAVIHYIMNNVEMSVPKDSNIIELSVSTITPELAREVLSNVLDFYLERHIEVHSAQASPDFFEAQTAKMHADLEESENALSEFKKRFNIISLEDQKRLLLAQRDNLQRLIGEEDSLVLASSAKIAAMEQSLNDREKSVELLRTTGLRNEKKEDIAKRLVELRMREIELSKRYQPAAPVLADLRQQIALLDESLSGEPDTKTQVTIGLNETRLAIEKELESAKSVLKAHEARKQSLVTELAEREKELETLHSHEMEMTRLERQVAVREKEYLQYRDNLQRSTISAALDRDKVSNVSIVQPATLPELAIGLHRNRKIILGVFLGVISGLALAFLLEFLDSSLKTKEDVEKRLGVPVVTISRKEFDSCT